VLQVFVNAVSAVRRVGALLKLLGLPAVALHAQQQQRQRLKALDRFKSHPHGVLVATDVAARGLDIPNVQVLLWVAHVVPLRQTARYMVCVWQQVFWPMVWACHVCRCAEGCICCYALLAH
jgi:late competence protein required for DNA uptake (superfamily II DNA/RNA helicase)